VSCLICREPTAKVACADCLAEIKPGVAITPEQIWMRGGDPTTAALVDPWGRLHALQRLTPIGREAGKLGLCIVDSTISARHASISLDGAVWTVRDLRSRNGTYVEGHRVTAETPISDGDQLRVGRIMFYFVDNAPDHAPEPLGSHTVRGPVILATHELERVGVREIEVVLREPTGGGGGIVEIDGRQAQLTLPQFELVTVLLQRARGGGQDASQFVSVAELLRLLSLQSTTPSEDHVRQLVRRLRRTLFKAGIVDVIESRYGAGYRLRLRTM
jgi:FHA domain